MKSRGRILFGLALGFLVPLLWLGFRAVFFDSETIVTASFQRRAAWFDGTATALLGWLVGSIFASGFTLQALGDLFSNPSKTLQPAIANLVGSKLWHGAGLLVLVVEIAGILQNVPRRLPELSGGFAWYHSSRGLIADEASAQRQALGRIGAYLRSTASEVAVRKVPLATVRAPKLFGRLETTFIDVTVASDNSAGCASLGTGRAQVNLLLSDQCLAGYSDALATAIAAGRPWTSSPGELDLAITPGAPPVLTIKKAGVIADRKLEALLSKWQRQKLLTQRDERLALEETIATIGTEILTEELADRAIENLLPSGPGWAVPTAVQAGRLSSLLRLIYSCGNCSLAARSRLLDRLTDPVRAKFARSGPTGRVVLTDGRLAREWARMVGWWAEERKDSKVLDVALSSLYNCGAEVHQALLENLGNSAADYLELETRETLKERVAKYSRSHEDFCGAVVTKAQDENLGLRPLLNEWMTEAVKMQTSCDLGPVLYGGVGAP